ncbi:polysaccharide deacetylase family protein [Oxalobacteraceae bacterium R-40]|uniref:Polysaccharide deacetylase family protein n=1 Tax=Keguizhuia sedimenti TaxID=3064264 RepID=A0ABU1BRH9_9BURK|nr:polysaccharide deacetylase family protein [Oxalobacteraceae bacterium R-40]
MSVTFTCSIDDGHPSDLKVAELLARHGLTGTFYVPIKNREGPPVMAPSEIRALSDQFEIGSHTYDHCFLKSVNIVESHFQVTEGKKQLEDILGKQVKGFCYPGGKYRPGDVEIVKASGFKYARTTVNLCFDVGVKPYEMPTTVQLYPHNRNVYLRNFAKSGDWMKRQKGLGYAMLEKDWTRRLYALFDHATRSNGCFHLWWHSKDIEEHQAWGELDRFFSYVSTNVRPENRLTNGELAERYF